MTATLATPETVTGINWYSDLGAPNHVTKDVSNVITWGRTEFIWEMAQVHQLIIWDLRLFFLSFAPKSYL